MDEHDETGNVVPIQRAAERADLRATVRELLQGSKGCPLCGRREHLNAFENTSFGKEIVSVMRIQCTACEIDAPMEAWNRPRYYEPDPQGGAA